MKENDRKKMPPRCLLGSNACKRVQHLQKINEKESTVLEEYKSFVKITKVKNALIESG